MDEKEKYSIDSINSRRYYTMQEAINFLNVSKRTLYKYMAMGPELGGISYTVRPCNGRRLVKGEEMIRFLEVQPASQSLIARHRAMLKKQEQIGK